MTRNSFFQNYRLVPIMIGSLILFALICILALLIWSVIAYLAKSDITSAEALPNFLWLGALFITVAMMTIFTKGGTIFPALFLSIVAVILSCILVDLSVLSVGGLFAKLGLSLLAAIVSFTLAKLLIISSNTQRYNSKRLTDSDSVSAELQDLDRDPPPMPKSGGKKLF